MKIRKATRKDFENIWPIFHAIAMEGTSYTYSPNTTEEEALELWFNPAETVYVVEENDTVLGTYGIRSNQLGLGSHVANASFMIAAESRGRGLGQQMIDHCMNEARKMGFKAMQFNAVVSTNKAAVSLWQKNGFNIVGVIPKAYNLRGKELVDLYVMHRFL